MAKKSNKTEHVLKLITKNDETAQDDDFFVIDQEISENGTSAVRKEVHAKQDKIPEEIKIQPEITPAPQVKEIPVAPAPRHKETPSLRAFREQESTGSAILEQNDNLVNIAEVLAKEKLALVMERMKVCTCKTCVNDVLALALNSLPTKYVTTDAGKQYFQLDIYKKQYETDILAALTKACVRVKAAPRH
jgi:competence protein ComFB